MNKSLILLTSFLLLPVITSAQDQPNILFIFADDQSWETINAMAPPDMDSIVTPALDRLVNNGVAFTHAYNQGSWSGAVCVASRLMLNTGRVLWNARQVDNNTDAEAERAAGRVWSEYMKAAGYKTYMTGKWHVKFGADRAFDMTGSVRGGMPGTVNAAYNRPLNPDDPWDTWKPWDTSIGGFWSGGTHWSEVVANEAIGFIDDARQSAQPFFMYIAFNATHDPRQSPREYVDMYPWQNVKVPANYLDLYPYKDDIGCGSGLRDERLAPFPRTEFAVQVHRQEYYALVTHMDDQISRILDTLDSSGMADNTYIFYSADHGLGVGRHALLGKQNMYDHSVRVPLMVNGPGIPQGEKITAPVYLQDIMPSVLELAGVPHPDHVGFKSLMPLIDGRSQSSYDAIYGAYLTLQRMVTMGDYKLIYYPAINRPRLYNLKEDPNEINDLAQDPAYFEVLTGLFDKLKELQQDVEDDLVISYSPPDPSLKYVDDSETDKITYTGNWNHTDRGECYNGTISVVSAAGAEAEFTFTGIGVQIGTQRGPGAGIFDIYLDGVRQTTYDSYNDPHQYQVVAWEAMDLANEEHTVRIVNTGDRNASGTGTNVHLDYIAYKIEIPSVVKPVGYSPTSTEAGNSLVRIFDINGRLVTEFRAAGKKIVWNGTDSRGNTVVPGIYILKQAGLAFRKCAVAR
jgi:choline-sulfatase